MVGSGRNEGDGRRRRNQQILIGLLEVAIGLAGACRTPPARAAAATVFDANSGSPLLVVDLGPVHEIATVTVEPGSAPETSTVTVEPGSAPETSTVTVEPGSAPETSTVTVDPGNAPEISTITVEPGDEPASAPVTGVPADTAAGSTLTDTTPDTGAGEAENLNEITVEGVWTPTEVGPQRGLRLTRDQLPANVQSVTAEELRESRATSLTDFMSQSMQSVNINDYQGNPFQADVQFRGFSASPQIGTPQGLSVFFDGIRVNEPFGDVVNWDMIPLNAIQTFDVFPGSNPLFGLNTLGGALSIRSKNGFEDEGIQASLLGGSWGRIHGQLSAGGNRGPVGAFVGITGFHEDGWRTSSPSDVQQAFTKLSLRTARIEIDGSMLLAGNDLVGNGLLPLSLHREDPGTVFTAPDTTENSLRQFSLNGLVNVNDVMNITAQIYRRTSDRSTLGADAYAEGFADFRGSPDSAITGIVNNDPFPLCRFVDRNADNLLDWWTDTNNNSVVDVSETGSINGALTPDSDFSRIKIIDPVNIDDLCLERQYTYQARNGNLSDGTGVVEGTPIGLLTKTSIGQVIDGAALQFNWNLEKHAFMVGASIDESRADYVGTQRLGLIDADRNVYEDPANIDPIYLAARQDFLNNEFDGFSNTQSVYFSETYSPFSNLHLSFAGRYNYTRMKTNLTARQRSADFALDNFRDTDSRPDVILCPSADPSSCPADPNVAVATTQEFINDARLEGSLRDENVFVPTSDRPVYASFNPSVGINFLPREDTNIFLNWSQGTRTPSVVELGCAFDGTLVDSNFDGVIDDRDQPASLAGAFACTLPSTLSGDPFLPQIFARSTEFGMRGTFKNGWEWNASVYRTKLNDDIYLIGIRDGQSFFDTIGETRRQGFELGLAGNVGIVDFSLNYGFTEATFQSQLFMNSERNSSRELIGPANVGEVLDSTGRPTVPLRNMITVEPGDRMPGVPLHNFNASMTAHLLENFDLGISMVAHSSSYVRGNENNDHRTGVLTLDGFPNFRQIYNDAGEVDGYAIFNLKANYRVGRGFTLFGQINNVLDKEYFTAGRLGVNPFSPPTVGAIGPSGWNYNSNDWLNATFVAPGAPRAFWVGLEYQF